MTNQVKAKDVAVVVYNYGPDKVESVKEVMSLRDQQPSFSTVEIY